MSFIDKFRLNPTVLALRARDAFRPVAVVQLRHWFDLDTATAWCEHRWRSHGRHYRRRIFAADRRATFEFASHMDALAFNLASAGRFRKPRLRVR